VDAHLVSLLSPMAFEAEQYRTIAYTIEQIRKETSLSIIAVSSPLVGDGKTITAINLAATFARFPETKVLLIDMDLRRPSLLRQLGLNHGDIPGLIGLLSDHKLSLTEAVQQSPTLNLGILPVGRPSAVPHEILESPQLGEILQEARRSFDYVIVDTPPLIPFPDCQVLKKWIDGFVVVVAAHKTPRKLLEEAINSIEPAKTVGLIFNNDDCPVFGYYSYYTYGYSHDDKKVGLVRRALKTVRTWFEHSSR
jgi:protein-tyrosine kinase